MIALEHDAVRWSGTRPNAGPPLPATNISLVDLNDADNAALACKRMRSPHLHGEHPLARTAMARA